MVQYQTTKRRAHSYSRTNRMRNCVAMLVLIHQVVCLPPNFEDLDLSVDQANGEVVNVVQQDPQSNNIHIAHNNPVDSDITVEQTNPFNTTLHISLNVGTGSKVNVKMSNAKNLQLHISFNGMGNSECTVDLDQIFNSTVHLSFQNPTNTPVTLSMNRAVLSNLHVSQNIPRKSPMKITMEEAENCQIHISQAVPMSSPLTWKLTGDPEKNQIVIAQNAADDLSPLDCTPECPQEEYVYDYQYAGSAHGDAQVDAETDAIDVEIPDYDPVLNQIDERIIIEDYQDISGINNNVKEVIEEVIKEEDFSDNPSVYEEYTVEEDVAEELVPAPVQGLNAVIDLTQEAPGGDQNAVAPLEDVAVDQNDVAPEDNAVVDQNDVAPVEDAVVDQNDVAPVNDAVSNINYSVEDNEIPETGSGVLAQCPGGDLESCVDVCPGTYGPRVFGACVSSCGKRCP